MNYHPDLLSTVLKMITALVIVLGGLFIVFYFLRRILKRDVGGEFILNRFQHEVWNTQMNIS
jgi:hypothetical protein